VNRFLPLLALLPFAGCGGGSAPDAGVAPAEPETAAVAEAPAEAAPRDLAAILDAQPDEVKARYPYRKPKETLEFFGIEPGMTVVEALPGGGWYTKLLLPYLGESGTLIGADYPYKLWEVNPSVSEERREEKKTWVADWTAQAEGWRNDGDAAIAAFQMAEMPADMQGTADAVLFVRALHNLARWEDEAGTLSSAIQDAYDALKPGGIVGIIQHEARPEMPDDWADGSNGYLKRDFVIARMEAVGFELVDSSDMHANPKDQPTTDDAVWRLPPSLGTSRDDPELREQMQAIGESNRMTLKFRKPVA
jgi:predicted methyltransferase